MKSSTWNLIIGILIGAIITAAGFLMFNTNSTTANLESNPSRLSTEVTNGIQNQGEETMGNRQTNEMDNFSREIENGLDNTANKVTNGVNDIMQGTGNMVKDVPEKVENGINTATNALRNMMNGD